MKIKDLPKHKRPREKLLERGTTALKDKELLAILLRTGRSGKNAIEIAEDILVKYPMKQLLSFTYDDLVNIKGIDTGKACTLLSAFELTKRALEIEDNNLPLVITEKDVLAHVQEICNAKKEHFVVLCLNARDQLIHKEIVSVGTLNASLVHPREVFKPAIDNLAVSVFLVHNHPSGDTEPSADDIEITKKLIHAGKLLEIEVLDHIIVSQNSSKSLKKFLE